MTVCCAVRPSQYYDSVVLMNVARKVRALPGIDDAALVMGTQANKSLLKQAQLESSELEDAGPNDLVVAIKGAPEAVADALRTAEELLTSLQASARPVSERSARTLRGAARALADANVAVISVGGRYAAAEAWAALRQGLHVLLFSDNVSLEDEIALKRYAVGHGLFLMGPGAGTAIIQGVALAFANAVPRGPVGIASAAGTGLQEVSSLLAQEGVGVSQGIGVGGRDLSDEVGALMMLQALQALQDDEETTVLVAISKLPSPRIAGQVIDRLSMGRKPAVVIFMGGQPLTHAEKEEGQLHQAWTLQEAALLAAALARNEDPIEARLRLKRELHQLRLQAVGLKRMLNRKQRFLRGLFSGGSLCEEAIRIWGEHVGKVWSNSPQLFELKLPDPNRSNKHCALDLGGEEYTLGRPHPMLDNDLRIRRLTQEAADPSVAVIQMDVVLGFGAHPDPAGELGPAIGEARRLAKRRRAELPVVCSITGTMSDPQNLERQRSTLASYGATVLQSNAAASRLAALIVSAKKE